LSSFTIISFNNFASKFEGEFLRVKTNSAGDSFKLPIDFETPFNTVAGLKYSISMYTLINCPKPGCEAARDSISVQIKEGANGIYKEIYLISGRERDFKWKQELFSFKATQNLLSVSR
jgi:hypothetical protein